MYALPDDSDAEHVSVHQSVGHLQPDEEYQDEFESPSPAKPEPQVKKPLVARSPVNKPSEIQHM